LAVGNIYFISDVLKNNILQLYRSKISEYCPKYSITKSYSLFVLRDAETEKKKKCRSITELVRYIKSNNIPIENIQPTQSVSNKEQREITNKLKEK